MRPHLLVGVFAATVAGIATPLRAQEARAVEPSIARAVDRAIASDPPRDTLFPLSSAFMRIPVHGAMVRGMLSVASGKGPHPTLVLLQGTPGFFTITDVGNAARRAGFNVLYVRYRGSWGSQGTYTLGGAIDDAQAAVAWLTSPAVAAEHRVDPSRVYLMGHSFGGFVAMMLAARTHAVKGIAHVSGWDPGADHPSVTNPSPADVESWDYVANAVGTTTGQVLLRELAEHAGEYRVTDVAPKVADRPILLLYAKYDTDVTPRLNYIPLRDALRKAGAARVDTAMIATDHEYGDARVALTRTVLTWLLKVDARR